ncbi:MAG: tetratricopeptide repeat protein [Planctomycetota bacterium]|jgi:tetratricopeptide (TPR) repeat protein|nr:tetratricopeptide repeat protein [Planctomycetota bacterium]
MEETKDAKFSFALSLLGERRYLEALDAFSELVALSPEMTGAYGNRGLCYLGLGLDRQARNDFETVLQLDPNDAMGHAMLGELTRLDGDPEETLRHAVDALDIDPDEQQALFIRGWLFARAGQHAEAAEDFSRYLERSDDNEDVRDLRDACLVLASDNPVDEFGDAIDVPEKVEEYLGRRGWSFDCRPYEDYEARGMPCPYAHCIRNRPPLSPEAPDGCPVFGCACPGRREQAAWCRENPRYID